MNGNYLKGDSVDGLRKYIFLHMESQPLPGDRMAGSVIGKVGATGYVINAAPHLHLSVMTTDSEAARLNLRTLAASPGWKYVSFVELAKKF